MSSKGNVLFLILIAVALFAALSYAVTQSSRGGGNADQETLALNASQMVQFAQDVDFAVKRLMLVGGYDKSEISFEYDGNAVNGNCGDDRCKVFHPDGGGVIYWDMPESWRQPAGTYGASAPLWRWNFSKDSPVIDVGTNCADASCNDVMLLYRAINRELCIEINNQLGIDNPSGEPPENTVRTNNDWNGSMTFYNASESVGNLDTNEPQAVLNGQYTGCFRDPHTADLAYHFYHVVIEF